MIDYLNHRDDAWRKKGTTYGAVLESESFLRLWTFIVTHGERFTFKKSLDATIGRKKMHGACIWQSLDQSSLWIRNKPTELKILDYAEGLSSFAFVTLHAWNVLQSSRHSFVIDATWEIPDDVKDYVWYQGVVFEREFFDWVRNEQTQNRYKHTLPYLKTGACCLTYQPLLEGRLDEYRIRDGDRDRAIDVLHNFADCIPGIRELDLEKT